MKTKLAIRSTLCTLVLSLLLLIPSVAALGISVPSPREFYWQPGLSLDIPYRLVNSLEVPRKASINIGGDIAQYITASQYEFVIPPKGIAEFTVSVRLPQEEPPAGPHTITVGATEEDVSGAGISARVSVRSLFSILVPYKGKWPQFDRMDIGSGAVGERVGLSIYLNNLGDTDVNSAFARIKLSEGSREVGTTVTSSKPIPAKGSAVLEGEWMPGTNGPGLFSTEVTITADDKTLIAQKDFMIGLLDVKLLEYTQNLTEGAVGAINVVLGSVWNKPVKVKLELAILKDGKTFATIASPEATLEPWKNITLPLYWQVPAQGVEGNYTGQLTIYYENERKIETLSLLVHKRSEEKKPVTMFAFLIGGAGILALLVIINIVLLFHIKKKRDDAAVQFYQPPPPI